jgi:hypothetical protein
MSLSRNQTPSERKPLQRDDFEILGPFENNRRLTLRLTAIWRRDEDELLIDLHLAL